MHCDVERRHRHREVHRVPEPEPVLVDLAPALGEERVVRVHLLPALAPRRGLDLVGARERARLRRRGHRPCIQQPRCALSGNTRSAGRRCSSSRTSRGPSRRRPRCSSASPRRASTRSTGRCARRGGFLGEPPFTVGWDVAGVVEEVGMGVTWLSPGDRVFGMPRFPREAACYAEYVTSPSRQLARIPEGLVRRRGGGASRSPG